MVNFSDDNSYTPTFFENESANWKFLQLPIAKSLIFDLNDIWCQVQQLSRLTNGELRLEDVLLISRRYREAIKTFYSVVGTSNNAANSEIYNAQILWSLTESIYFHREDTPIALNLIDWGKESFNESNKLVEDRLNDESSRPEEHEFYWNSIILSVVNGNLNSTVRLLRKHSRFEKDGPIQQICFFCESFQVFLEQGIPNPNAFLDVQRKVRDALHSGTFKRSEQLTMIAGLLIGKNDNYEKCARALFENWYELLAGYTLFSCPGANIQNIRQIAQTLYNNLCPKGVHVSLMESLVSDIDRPIFSILSQNLIDMLKQICERSSLWWFPVHFIDLLYRYDSSLIAGLSSAFKDRPILDENNQPLSVADAFSVHDAILTDYGNVLMASQDYWIISADYLNAVLDTETNEPYLEAKLDSVNKAEYIYSQAVKNNHPKTLERVTRWFIERYVDEGCLSEALCWALRSNLSELVNFVANKILSSANAESISQMRIFDAMSEMFYRYPGLLLLQRFYEFRRCLSQGHALEAASRIHELVTSGIAPIKFQVVLFDQMAKLLDASEFIKTPLDRDSLYDLMKAINKFQLQSSIINPPGVQKNDATTMELNTKIKMLRQALCNALASQSIA